MLTHNIGKVRPIGRTCLGASVSMRPGGHGAGHRARRHAGLAASLTRCRVVDYCRCAAAL